MLAGIVKPGAATRTRGASQGAGVPPSGGLPENRLKAEPQRPGRPRGLGYSLVAGTISLLAGCSLGWPGADAPGNVAANLTAPQMAQLRARQGPLPVRSPAPAGLMTAARAPGGESGLVQASFTPAEAGPALCAAPQAPELLTLPEAIRFALANSPRLRAALAAIDRARGREETAFAPFLPQIDMLNRYVATSPPLSPGAPGPTGGLVPAVVPASYSAWQSEFQLQWMLYDFGRTGGRYHQAVVGEGIAQLQAERARQTVAYDVAAAYLQGLEAAATRRIARQAIRRAEAVLADTRVRRAAGVALRADVLRGEVQLSETRDALVRAEQAELDALARLNNAMGRAASLPLRLVEAPDRPAFRRSLAECLAKAAGQRPEVGAARDRIAAARFGREAARGEFLPSVQLRASFGRADGSNIVDGWQEGVGLHINVPLYHGGGSAGELHAADADIRQADAQAQEVLDTVGLEVTVAYRGVVSARARAELARPAVVQARENLRLVRDRYRNGTATPTDVVDAETTLTRSQQRYTSARIEYLAALARLAYALGFGPDKLLVAP